MHHWSRVQELAIDHQVESDTADQGTDLIVAELHEFAKLLLAFASHLFHHLVLSLVVESSIVITIGASLLGESLSDGIDLGDQVFVGAHSVFGL